ncbi:MAG: hypothetical protein MRJ66_20305 [Nitrospira sp.]|nr:hypothetical protein [Nitrospira sp.]
MFITVYQQFEFTLMKVCLELEKDYPNSQKLEDLKGKGVTRAYTYLKKVAGIGEPFEHKSWSRIKDLNKLRNTIVHSDAIIGADEMKKLVARIKQWAPVSHNKSRILLSEHFSSSTCSFLREQVEQLGHKLHSAGW